MTSYTEGIEQLPEKLSTGAQKAAYKILPFTTLMLYLLQKSH